MLESDRLIAQHDFSANRVVEAADQAIEFWVALRCCLLHDVAISLHAGKDSILETEPDATGLKQFLEFFPDSPGGKLASEKCGSTRI